MKVGDVIRLFVPETNPPKVKYLIIVATNSTHIGTVYINTDLRINALHSPALKALQIPIVPDQCKCLTHDSYVDCSTLVPRDKGEINSILQKEPGRKETEISGDFLNHIIETVKSSRTISLSDKKLCGLISEI